MNYDKVNYILGENDDPQIKSLETQKETIKKQIAQLDEKKKQLNLQLAEISKKIAEKVELIQEDARFELEMLISEKDTAKKVFKEMHPKMDISFNNFNMKGVKTGDASIITDLFRIFFEETSILVYSHDKLVKTITYDELYEKKDIEDKWELIFK